MDENGIPSGNEIGAALSGGAAFIEKLDQATGGWWVVHKAKRQLRAAEKKMALSKAALEGIGIQLSDDEVRAIAFSALQEVKGFENLCAVIERVNIPEDAPAEDIEDEWMSRFVECSKEAFSEWKRVLLSDVASAKASDPNALSIGALNCIARMEAQDMETLKKMRAITPDLSGLFTYPIILIKDDSLLSIVELDTKQIERLRDIGVLREVENRIRYDACTREPQEPFYDGKPYIVCDYDGIDAYITLRFDDVEIKYFATRVSRKTPISRDLDYFFDFGIYSYTTAGRELINLVPCHLCPRLQDYLTQSQNTLSAYESVANRMPIFAEREFERAIRDIVRRMDRGIR